MNVNPPPTRSKVVDKSDLIDPSWQEFASAMYFAMVSLQRRGTTAQRPTKGLYNFLPYGDETLGIPIWYLNGDWIDAQGNVV